jgi:hypothetical protein
MLSTKVVEKLETHFIYLRKFAQFVPGMRMYRKCGISGLATGGNKMWRMRFAYRVKAQIHKHVIYITYCLYTATVVTRTRLGIKF